MQSPKKVSFHTLGCKLNFSETSALARQFQDGGYVRTERSGDADICVVNSCSVTEHADKKCRNLIRKIHRENPQAIIAVTGCYAQLKPADIAAIDGVDIVLSNNDKGELFSRVTSISSKGKCETHSCSTEELTSFFAAFSGGDRTRAFLKVQDGCDYKCTYCTIHNARGSSRNIAIAELITEARMISAEGRKEIVITGVNTGDFGRTTGENFIDLLRALDGVEGIARYRISSIEPNLLTDDIIDFCATSNKFQHHFHIPLQSGSDEILGKMRRRYNSAMFAGRIEAVRKRMPDAFIGIDVIVGFPGETEANFRETYEFLEKVEPAYLHIFPYSIRANTPAADLAGKVNDSVKTARVKELGALSQKLSGKFYGKAIGRKAWVLFESSRRNGFMYGFTGNYIKVGIPYDKGRVNMLSEVLLTGINDSGDMSAVFTGREK